MILQLAHYRSMKRSTARRSQFVRLGQRPSFKKEKGDRHGDKDYPSPSAYADSAAAPALKPDDGDGGAEYEFVFETDVGGAVGVEYVAVPVVGRCTMVLRLDGPGAGKTSSVDSEQSG